MAKKQKKTPLLPPIGEKYFEPMGASDFANMPADARIEAFKASTDYRGGIPNSFTMGINQFSDIKENEPNLKPNQYEKY